MVACAFNILAAHLLLSLIHFGPLMGPAAVAVAAASQGPDYKKILRLSYDVIITYDNRKSNLR